MYDSNVFISVDFHVVLADTAVMSNMIITSYFVHTRYSKFCWDFAINVVLSMISL